MSTDALLAVRHLRVQFGRLLAVNDISFDLHAGHLLGLIGPNGAGKTTTLRAASGLQPVSTGTVHVMDHDIFTHPTVVGHHLGLTPDTPALYDPISVEDYLAFIGRCYGLSPAATQERTDHWLEALWLQEKRKAAVKTLSRGMRQRLAVARTLLPDPGVVLMDEPAAGLDPAGRVQFRQLLANLRDQGKAIIVSSHILADLAEYCTHIAIMEHGRFLNYGTVAEVTGAAGRERGNYRVVLARRVGDAATRIAGIEGLQRLQIDGDVLTFEYDRDRRAAAALLAQLISAGLPVAEFHALEPDLEQAYLRSGIGQVD
ncbi:MAG TPA: ABC transporter ATP-binding protein [Phycisphaerae bacterium]|nr:ABC transporter ATP-binding protein [Phycisphaerae bacterium]